MAISRHLETAVSSSFTVPVFQLSCHNSIKLIYSNPNSLCNVVNTIDLRIVIPMMVSVTRSGNIFLLTITATKFRETSPAFNCDGVAEVFVPYEGI
jgi:hypothetical protein